MMKKRLGCFSLAFGVEDRTRSKQTVETISHPRGRSEALSVKRRPLQGRKSHLQKFPGVSGQLI